jgi:hypothetical protein
MNQEHARLLDAIDALPRDWHGAGSVRRKVLEALIVQCERIGEIRHSAETGAGRTTLVLSHLSGHHVVFSKDGGDSLSQARTSPLLRSDRVEFIEGSTQRTLPAHRFEQPLQVVLIDGPHAYPFPDLEYYFLYPHLAPGGLLVLDDINIPSIGRMYDILKTDDMFELAEVVADTAFMVRTDAPCFDPYGDRWWTQGYNRSHHEFTTSRRLRKIYKLTPQALRGILRAVRGSHRRPVRSIR